MARTPAVEQSRPSLSHVMLGVIGKVLIWAGLLLLGFTAYQLWGTGIQTARFQEDLEKQFTSATAPPETTTATNPLSTIDANGIDVGDAIGKISIEKIKVESWIVAGVTYKALKKGPGLFPDTALPGSLGNTAIAGHRSTFGAPFADLDKLEKGDVITITTREGSFTYDVRSVDIVKPSAVEVIETADPTKGVLTLVTCHPKWTSANRLIVSADLREPVAPGLVWLATMFSMLVVVQRSFAVETADGALDALRVAGVDTRAMFLGKSLALGAQLCALDAVLVATAFFLYNVQLEPSGVLVVFVTVVLACIGLGFIGTLYGGLAAGARGRETLLPLLLLPVVAPVLIGATRATEAGFNSGGAEVSEGWPWSGLLLIFAVIFGVVGSVAFGPLIDE